MVVVPLIAIALTTGPSSAQGCDQSLIFAPKATCRLLHIDYYERRALENVPPLFDASYALSKYSYEPATAIGRRPVQSEAARISPEILAENKDIDVILVHGSTFTGAGKQMRPQLGTLIESLHQARPDIRGYVVYSSAEMPLDAAQFFITTAALRDKVCFQRVPVRRFAPGSDSARNLVAHVQKLCGR